MPYKQVCAYKNNTITPLDYAEVVHRVAKSYNAASVLVEVNNMGEQVAHALHMDFEYDNMLFTENAGREGKRITSGFGNNVEKGITTTKNVKATGCSILKLLIEQNQLIINDFSTIQELSTFSKKVLVMRRNLGTTMIWLWVLFFLLGYQIRCISKNILIYILL
jgi:thiamine kinase-like enzyme